MTIVQPRGLDRGDEELASVGIGAAVGHRQNARAGVPKLEILVGELGSVDGFAAGSVARGEVAALAHEVGDDAVESGSLVSEALLAGAQGPEIFSSLGHDIRAELEY